MKFHARYLLAAAAGLGLTPALPAQLPATYYGPSGPAAVQRPATVNQQMADTIAGHLRMSGNLQNYAIDIAYQDGTAYLAGTLKTQPQREEALRIVQGVPGVERVIDRLRVEDGVTRAAAEGPAAPPAGAALVEPQPIFSAAPPSPYDVNPPKMPPYAWPTYAPYNNYSRVAYPQAYPYQAWPYIGPVYPYPKIPLGWRSIKLEWEDGYWWYSKTATKYDWWRLRYW